MAVIGTGQAQAILWAQWRALVNYSFRRSGLFQAFLTFLFVVLWYGLWSFLAWSVYLLSSSPSQIPNVARTMPLGLLLVFAYWQFVPLMMASGGLSLDLRRLIAYPITHRSLFTLEVLLRISTSLEMLLVTIALCAGLWRNPSLPWWAPLPLLPFTLMNLFLAAGIRELFTRWMARKYFREVLVFCIVLMAALPQVLLFAGVNEKVADMRTDGFGRWWPWSATATLLFQPGGSAAALVIAWCIAAGWFGRMQFQRSLRFDVAEARARKSGILSRPARIDAVFRLPSRFLPDPLAALVEKELRFLSRAPRFRLLFLMGFSFGLLIWLPLAFSRGDDSVMRTNFLTIVSAYALMLLGEVCFWNNLGLDRSAAQAYFVMPVRLSSVLMAKNLAAALFIILELTAVTVFCWLLRLPVTFPAIAEAFACTAVLSVFMMTAGNLLSVHYPGAIDPAQSWRSGSMSRVQAYLLLIYPLASLPVLLAFGARYAFDSDLAFYGALALGLVTGAIAYSIALESAAATAESRPEHILTLLSSGEGPVGS